MGDTKELQGHTGTLNKDAEIEVIDVRLTADRKTKGYIYRRAEAKLLRYMTDAMRDARYEIQLAFTHITAGQGYATQKPDHVRGGIDNSLERAEYIKKRYLKPYFEWRDKCPPHYAGCIINECALGFTCKEIAEQRGLDARTVRKYIQEGLTLYCELRGWAV